MPEIYKIMQMFNIQDYAKDLLLKAENELQEKGARSLLERTNQELEKLYTPTLIENV